MTLYVDVAPSIPLPPRKDIFTYESKRPLAPGTFVKIPIGPRQVLGIVIRTFKKKPPYRTKEVGRVYDVCLSDEQLALGGLIAGHSLGGLGFTLRLFQPPSLARSAAIAKRRSHTRQATTHLAISSMSERLEIIKQQVQGVLRTNRQALIIVPERWMIERFLWATPFHAGLPMKERQAVWNKVASGEPMVVVGTQKAFFLPWRTLDLIVLDEEQLSTHKLWDGYPRASNQWLLNLAIQIYKSHHIYSGSVPSLATHYLHKQKTPVLAYKIPKMLFQVVPFTFADRRNRRLLPEEAVGLLRKLKQEKKNILIIHNEIDSRAIQALRSLRLLKKNQVWAGTSGLFATLQDKQFDHIVWMFPERAITYPDIRSSERAYIMLARLATLAKKRSTSIILITRQGELVEQAFSESMSKAFDRMLEQRRTYAYPPFSDMVRLTFRNKTKAAARQRAVQARQVISKKLIAERDTIRILGPYQGFKDKGTKGMPESHVLLLGNLDTLAPAYRPTLPDIVDIDPNTVL